MAKRFETMGAQEKAGTPAELGSFVKEEMAKYKKIVGGKRR